MYLSLLRVIRVLNVWGEGYPTQFNTPQCKYCIIYYHCGDSGLLSIVISVGVIEYKTGP